MWDTSQVSSRSVLGVNVGRGVVLYFDMKGRRRTYYARFFSIAYFSSIVS